MRAHRAGRQAGHGPRGQVVLVQDVEHLLAVALPPATRMAADQGAGQATASRVTSRPPGHGGAQPGDPDDLLHRGDLLGQDLLPGRSDLVRAAALGGGQRPRPARRSSRASAPYKVPGSMRIPLKPAMSVMIA